MTGAIAWLKDHKWWLVACSVLSVAGYGVGRFATPSKVTVLDESVIRWTAGIQEQLSKQTTKASTRKTARVVSEILPGGGRRTTTDYVLERGPVVTLENRTTVAQSSGTQESSSSTTKEWDAPRLTLGATIGYDGSIVYGGFITYRVAGPLVLMGQGEGGAAGWSARVGGGINF